MLYYNQSLVEHNPVIIMVSPLTYSPSFEAKNAITPETSSISANLLTLNLLQANFSLPYQTFLLNLVLTIPGATPFTFMSYS